MIVEKVPKYFSAKNIKICDLIFFIYRLICDDKINLSRQNFSSVRAF
jgi:hypothetical protein